MGSFVITVTSIIISLCFTSSFLLPHFLAAVVISASKSTFHLFSLLWLRLLAENKIVIVFLLSPLFMYGTSSLICEVYNYSVFWAGGSRRHLINYYLPLQFGPPIVSGE